MAPRALFGRSIVARVAAAILVIGAAALWWQSQSAAPWPEGPRRARESVVFAPLQRLTPIRIERRESVVQWQPVGPNRAEYREFTVPCGDAAALAVTEEPGRDRGE